MPYPHLSEALPQLADPGEIAEYFGVKRQTIERQLRSGKLPGIKIGARWMVHVPRLRDQLNNRGGADG